MLIADTHTSFAGEAPVTTNQRYPVLVEPADLRTIVERVNHLIATRERRRDVQRPGDRLGSPRYASRLSEDLGRTQQRLGRHARIKRASPPTSAASTTATLRPAAARSPAATSPEGPAPITITSNASMPTSSPLRMTIRLRARTSSPAPGSDRTLDWTEAVSMSSVRKLVRSRVTAAV
jgi:hypothetical protein